MILDDILFSLKNEDKQKAYSYKGNSYSYREFYRFVCNIYSFIIKRKRNKQPIVIYGHKEVYMKAVFLACSFAGIPYVPIDVSMPTERIKLILEQVKPSFIIGDLNVDRYENISKNEIEKIMNSKKYDDIEKIYMELEDVYYIIFTSGSTGTPKGVEITYRNINSCINWLEKVTNAKNDVILNQANFSFDLSVADLYLSLVSISEHYILENETKIDFNKMFEDLKESKATISFMTPSFVDLLLLDKSFNEKLMPYLKIIVFCGEELLENTIHKLYERFKNIKIINMYGPTECTFAVTSIEIPRNINMKNIPVGKVKDGCEIFIIDKNQNVVQDGNIGEILIVGESVAKGYINGNQNNKFIYINNKRAYLTGDLGYIENNILYYKCRKDKQIKYKGYRIELTDIEKNLLELSYIEKAIVLPQKNNRNKTSRIIAFVILKKGNKKSMLEIRKDLEEKLPEYMCPTIKIIEDFPINQNGKCDERKLLEEY